MPLAVVMVDQGQNNYSEYINAVQNGRFLFTFWTPDDRLVDGAGQLPEEVIFPKSNQLEQDAGIFKTGTSEQKIRNYGWRYLQQVDKQINYFASRINLFQSDTEALMVHSRQLKQSGAADDKTAPWLVACAWVRANADRWQQWLPMSCPPGQTLDSTLTVCLPCSHGAFCVGGYEQATPCPTGFYCPANATAPSACRPGWTTLGAGAAAAADCSACAPGALYLPDGASGACVPEGAGLPAVLLPSVLALGCLAFLLARRQAALQAAGWQVRPEDLEYPEPEVVLGRGSQGVVLKAYRRGTPVAVKRLLLREEGVPPSFYGDVPLRSRWGGGLGGSGYGGRRQLLGWVRTLSDLRHPCITTVMGVVHGAPDGPLAMVLEFMELGSLADLLQNRMFCYDADFAMQALRNVACGMRFLHGARPPVVHGDLRAANVLIDRNLCAKISDVGLPPPCQRGREAGPSAAWAAPECTRGGPAGRTPMADVYAFGVLMFECLTRRPPGKDGDDASSGDSAPEDPAGLRVKAPGECSVEAAALLNNCVAWDPALRPTFGEVDRRLGAMDPALLQTSAMELSEGPDKGSQKRAWRLASPMTGSTSSMVSRRASSRAMLGMLPKHVAEALLRGEKVPPEPKEMVTMYFSDIVGYTGLCAAMPAGKVSSLLDRLYDKLDAAAQFHGVTKIETIGDAYLCVSNLGGSNVADHAARMARFSLAALRVAASTPVDEDDLSRGFLQIRVGLNSGPCTAGVVGRQCPKYTLFGDTINVAARMEQSGEPGRAQCTLYTARLIRAQDPSISLAPRGVVEIKGKGSMETFWILSDGEADVLDNPFGTIKLGRALTARGGLLGDVSEAIADRQLC